MVVTQLGWPYLIALYYISLLLWFFGHYYVQNAYVQCPDYEKFGSLSHHQHIPKNHEASHGTFFFTRITFSSHVGNLKGFSMPLQYVRTGKKQQKKEKPYRRDENYENAF